MRRMGRATARSNHRGLRRLGWAAGVSVASLIAALCPAAPVAAVQQPLVAQLYVSGATDRSNAQLLGGRTLSASSAIFLNLAPSLTYSGSVRFYLDGVFFKTDTRYPFDFNGTGMCGQVDPCPIASYQARLFDVTTLAQGTHTITAKASTLNSNLWIPDVSSTFTVVWPTGVVPRVYPDSVPGGVRTSAFDAGSFLYSGGYPSQTGVAAGTIKQNTAALIHGKVTNASGAALAGVTVTIAGHPEFGQTYSRSDGSYDLAVNGGQQLTIVLSKDNFITAHRQVSPAAQGWAVADTGALLGYAAASPTITPSSLPSGSYASAQGPTVTDSSGARRSTLLVPAGVTANLVMPDGSLQPTSTLTIQQTEFTVGSNGEAAMPAPLPPTSAYTYAVDLTLTEQRTAGAVGVEFSAPLWLYNENFLNFPEGTTIPAGYYDYAMKAWLGAPSGGVVKVVGVTGGLADVDIDGDGAAESAGGYAAVNMSSGERAKLATLYATGTSVWRVGVSHFSPWDLNVPWRLAADAIGPFLKGLGKALFPNCTASGSVIGCESQSLGEEIPLVGTGTQLTYQSARVPDNHAGGLALQLTPDSIPGSLLRVDLSIDVGGRHFPTSYAAAPKLRHAFDWDGLDVFGRQLNGSQLASVKLDYVYAAQYARGSAWADPGDGSAITGDLTRGEISLSRSYTMNVAASVVADSRGEGLGGLLLGVHHTYDPNSQTLALGDGTTRQVASLGSVISTLAGTGTAGATGDGGAASSAALNFLGGLVYDTAGNLYVSDTFNDKIRKIATDGTITTVAGTGTPGFGGDGGPAGSAQLHSPLELAVAPDGSLLVADVDNHRIRTIAADGTISTVAGDGTYGDAGDGGPATSASLSEPVSVAVAPDGTVFVADYRAHRIRRIAPDGTIHPYAGTGTAGFSGDGAVAAAATLNQPSSLVLDPVGNLYVADSGNHRVRRITPDGVIRTVAGTGTASSTGDGGAATSATLITPTGLALDRSGVLYVADQSGYRIRKIDTDGLISTLAGSGLLGSTGNNGQASAARLNRPRALTVAADGAVLVADAGNHQIRRIAPARPSLAQGHYLIPSSDGSVVYHFTPAGRHEQTLDALTGELLHDFGYDSQNRLELITDRDGNTIEISRPTASRVLVKAPDNNTTQLDLDSNGWASTITTPSGLAYQAAYTAGGLLRSFTDRKNTASTFDYDSVGVLTKDTGRDNKATTLERTLLDTGYKVVVTTPMGRATTYEVTVNGAGVLTRTVTDPAGHTKTAVQRPDGSSTLSGSGLSVESTVAPDPRWGMLVPQTVSTSVQAPGRNTVTTTSSQVISLNNNDVLDVASRTLTHTQGNRTWTTAYTTTGGVRKITSTSAGGRTQVSELDGNGRLAKATTGTLTPVEYSYDTRGRLKEVTQGARVTTTTFDAHGFPQVLTSPLGSTTFTNDLNGRPTTAVTPAGTITTAFDNNGHPRSITPPGRPARSMGYTVDDRLQDDTLPDVDANADQTHYTLNDDRQYTGVTLPSGALVSFGYDTAGRLDSVTRGSATVGFDWTGDHLTSTSSADGVTSSIGYSGGTLPTSVSWSGAGVSGSVTSTLDDELRLTGQAVSGASSVSFGYDKDQLLTSAGAETLTRNSATGLLEGATLGSSTTAIVRNGVGEPTRLTTSHSGSAVYDVQFTGRDNAGRVTDRIETIGGTATTDKYEYDSANRLWKVTRGGTLVSQYGYDSAGNLTAETHGASSVAATYDQQDRILTRGALSYTHNADGERTSVTDSATSQTTTYGWKLGRLNQITLPSGTVVTYLVDTDGQRVAKKVNGVLTRQYRWAGDQLVAETDATGTVLNRYVYGSRAHVPDYVINGGVTYRLVTDERGSVREVRHSATGGVAQRLDYDEWGRVTADSSPGFQPLGFAGGLYDTHTGLVRFGDREYDPVSTHWLSRDSIGFDGGLNHYTYADNDPINQIDPTGHSALGCFGDMLGLLSFLPGVGPIFLAGWAIIQIAEGNWGDLALGIGLVLLPGVGYLGYRALRSGRAAEGALPAGYSSFKAAKTGMGSPGTGNVFDHVVEQSQIARSGFKPQEIHNPFNMNPVSAGTNQLKANYYSTKQFFTGGGTVRDWLTGQSFVDQYEFGMDVLRRIENGIPLP